MSRFAFFLSSLAAWYYSLVTGFVVSLQFCLSFSFFIHKIDFFFSFVEGSKTDFSRAIRGLADA